MKNIPLVAKVLALCALSDILETVAQLFFKSGVNIMGETAFSNISAFAAKCVSSPLIWLGVITLIFQFFVWMLVLSRSDLSYAFLASSSSYIFIALTSQFILKERVSPARWCGVFIIIIGIILISRGYKKPGHLENV